MSIHRFFLCPGCSRRGIYLATAYEPAWECRYCGWWCFELGDKLDGDQKALLAANPGIQRKHGLHGK